MVYMECNMNAGGEYTADACGLCGYDLASPSAISNKSNINLSATWAQDLYGGHERKQDPGRRLDQ